MNDHILFFAKVCVVTFLLISPDGDANAKDPYAAVREQLVRDRIASAGVTNPRVLEAIRSTPRHFFVPKSERDRAYLDMALPIGNAQTISSPFIVASMTEALDPQPTDKVLEIGTGSGYQAAVLSPLVEHVYTIEIVEELGERAEKTLRYLDYKNVSVRVGDGFLGWPNAAPFDKIIVTCSPESVPQPLVDQLAEGGQMIIPVGQRYQQTLFRMVKTDGKLVEQPLQPTLFVPMTGEAEDKRIQKPDPANPTIINGDFEFAEQQSDGGAGESNNPTDAGSNVQSGRDFSASNLASNGTLAGEAPRSTTDDDFIPGWYYGRQVKRVEKSNGSDEAFHGKAFARFTNETPGLSSHLLQGIAIDAREVSQIRLSGRYRTENVRIGPTRDALPMIAISFYDELRRDLGTFSLGPFRGTRPWREASRLIRVPPQTREAIVRIGLFGATGVVDFDEIVLQKHD
ncbi:Protein-L-isoaspartate O-methyltransferase [Rubripirellula amarantea]|uniref:Protein-L-isoaspartate O-methyltransferase n=1 Tax=Rubripirellula amarantea TaxID=2527999 RepID=A0A5C5WR46_9BACT|nr:protein-L-isoaspartate(D-aspartate) O-methyltransferase [Rubripirellula amarantea]TWT52940.1 Protein-L-isoaspartate O-methyltransferase [Rubripirellula amarantea]